MSDTETTIDAQGPDSSPADVSPAAPPASSGDVLADMTREQRHEWRKTGQLPDAPRSPAESTPAEPAAQAASTDAQQDEAASEPAAPAKKNAETRIKELLAERDALRKQLEDHGRTTPPESSPPSDAQAASSPATEAAQDFPKFDAWANDPANEGKDYDDYTRALARHEWQQAQEAAAHQQTVQARAQTYAERVKAEGLDLSTLHADVLALRPIDSLQPGEQVGPLNAVAQEIVLSEHAPALLRHFSAHPEELSALADAPPAVVFRTMGRLEALLSARVPDVSASPAAPVSKAPPPPSSVGQKPSVPVDDADAAIARGDLKAFKAAKLRQDLAAAGR